jgi:DNA-binding YbaB/EbfC family protein
MSMFDAFKALGNPMELMRKAQQLQEQMKRVQDELASARVDADAGGGLVTATVNGKLELVKLKIDKTRLGEGDVELLEDVIVSAVAAAQAKAAEAAQDRMREMAAGAGLPPGMMPGGGLLG